MAKEDGLDTIGNGKEGAAANGNGSTGEEQHSTREKLSTRFKKLKKKLSHNTSTSKHGQADSAAEEKVGASETLLTSPWQPRCTAAMVPAAHVTKYCCIVQGIEHGSGASHTSSATLLDHSKQLQHLRGQDLFIQVGLPDFPHSSCKSKIASSAAQGLGTLPISLCQQQCRQAQLAGCALQASAADSTLDRSIKLSPHRVSPASITPAAGGQCPGAACS